jgi:FAD:protein FMN transferase
MHNYQSKFHAMGGENLIVVAAPDAGLAQAAIEAAAREVVRIQDKYSRYRNDSSSIVHQINSRAGSGDWTACDPETMGLLKIADRFHRDSGGVFDITSGVLRRAWDFKATLLPDQAQIDSLLKVIGWPKVELQDHRVRLPLAGMEIDFGGIGKEYAADRAGAVLRGRGIASGFVNLGGDIHAVGPRPDGTGWPVGVENPRRRGEVSASIAVSHGGLATSGDAEKYFMAGGRRYSHILNPQTGFPSDCWSSVSVASVSTLLAGFFSTTAMLLEHAGEQFLNQKTCRFLLLDRNGHRHASSAPTTGELAA